MTAFTPELRQEYLDLANSMIVTKESLVLATAQKLLKSVDRYLAIQKLTNVPAAFIMCVHERESSGNFSTYIGNGQLLNRVTTIEPIGHGPFASFEDGCVDAFQHEGLGKIPLSEWDEAGLCWWMEKYNGFGYRNHGIRSPYLWGGTNHQQAGKYVRDGVLDPSVMDPQLGGMAVYAEIIKLRPDLKLGKMQTVQPKPQPKQEESKPDVSNKPTDNNHPILDLIWLIIEKLFGGK